MKEAQKIDHYHRFISISDDQVIFVLPKNLLERSDMEIGDQIIAEPRGNGLLLKKVKQVRGK